MYPWWEMYSMSTYSSIMFSVKIYFLLHLIYWNIVNLQCYVSFRYTMKWICYTYTYIHCFLDPFPIYVFSGSSAGKESTYNAEDPGSIPGSGRSPGEGTGYPLQYSWVSLVAQMVKNLPTLWETLVWSLAWEDPLRRAWQPTPVFLPGESPWTKEPGGLQSMGSQRVRHNWATKHCTYYLILTQ